MQIVVSIKDAATGAFSRPAFVASRGQAVRSFQDELNRPDSDLARHPSDYDLFQLGEFDETTGEFRNNFPELLIRARDLVTVKG